MTDLINTFNKYGYQEAEREFSRAIDRAEDARFDGEMSDAEYYVLEALLATQLEAVQEAQADSYARSEHARRKVLAR